MHSHHWEETEMSSWLKREHYQFWHCKRCGLASDAVARGKHPMIMTWTSCDEMIVKKVHES
jgi:hypothetical protein